MKTTEPLNPQADEWQPRRSQLPSPLVPVIIQPPPFLPPPLIPVIFHPPPQLLPQLNLICIPPQYSYVIYPQPAIFTTTSPAEEKVANISHVQETGENTLGHSSQRRRYLPPRFRKPPPKHSAGAASISSHQRPKKQEWKPKATSNTTLKDSGSAASLPSSRPLKRQESTTLMIKNIPNQLRRDFMLPFLDHYCREDSLEYDFFYLPIDFRKLGNLGYCFVNLTTPAAAMKLKQKLTDYEWREAVVSNKVCKVSWASIQGKEATIQRFAKAVFKCDNPDFLPVIFEPPRNGRERNPPAPVTLGRRIRRS